MLLGLTINFEFTLIYFRQKWDLQANLWLPRKRTWWCWQNIRKHLLHISTLQLWQKYWVCFALTSFLLFGHSLDWTISNVIMAWKKTHLTSWKQIKGLNQTFLLLLWMTGLAWQNTISLKASSVCSNSTSWSMIKFSSLSLLSGGL